MKRGLYALFLGILCTSIWQVEAALPYADKKVIAALPQVPSGLNDGYMIERKSAGFIEAKYQMEVVAPHLKANEWQWFAAQPPELDSQKLVVVKAVPKMRNQSGLSPLKRDLLKLKYRARRPSQKSTSALELLYEAQLFSRKLVKSRATSERVAPLSKEEKLLNLRPNNEMNYTGAEFQAWQRKNDLVRKVGEGEVDFSRRVYQHIVRTFDYHYVYDQKREVGYICNQAKSDCGGLCVLFCSVLRSQGIPARCLAGRWAQSAKEGEIVGSVVYYQQHVKAEFFAQGVGWVPVDLSSAILQDKSKAKLKYFANDPGDFLTLHLDTGVKFDTVHFGKKRYTFLQSPSYWAAGEGNFDASTVTESWKVEQRGR